jgi:hypothetical protein
MFSKFIHVVAYDKMSFFSKKPKNSHSSDKKIPPIGAWGHYNKKQGGKTPSSAATDEKATLISVNSLALSSLLRYNKKNEFA